MLRPFHECLDTFVFQSSQCTELEALIPLKYTCSKLVLVGDPCQLQAVVKSKTASKYGYGQSLLKRLCEHFDARSATQGIGTFSWFIFQI